MKNWKILGLGIAAVSLISSVAAAEEPFTADKGQVGLQLMYGIDMEDGDLNPYGFGLAPQGGYTISPGVYIGGRFDYFFGGSEKVSVLGVEAETSFNIYQFLLEAGYDVGLNEAMVLRPKLGLGFGKVSAEMCSGGTCIEADSDTEFVLSPGVNFLYNFDPIYLNIDARYNMLMAEENSEAFVLGAGAGFVF